MSKKVTDLAALTSPADDDVLLIEDISAGATKKITRKDFLLGAAIQSVQSATSAVDSTTTVMPNDDTIPQSNEGKEFLSVAITPKSANSILVIRIKALVACLIANTAVGALYQDATANALAADANKVTAANDMVKLVIEHTMTAGTTSATTFKFRAGPGAADTLTINGSNAARKFGAIPKSFIEVTEYAG